MMNIKNCLKRYFEYSNFADKFEHPKMSISKLELGQF